MVPKVFEMFPPVTLARMLEVGAPDLAARFEEDMKADYLLEGQRLLLNLGHSEQILRIRLMRTYISTEKEMISLCPIVSNNCREYSSI